MIENDSTYKLYADGGCLGNPGLSAAGILILDKDDNEIFKSAVFLGQGTNNSAEYSAILEGLAAAARLKIKNIDVFSDSELVIRQLNNEYKMRSEFLKYFKDEILKLSTAFSNITFNHLKREYTDQPHRLAESMLNSRRS
ncbi:ribonuclease HI family protein [Elusimicrobiota bacterium]